MSIYRVGTRARASNRYRNNHCDSTDVRGSLDSLRDWHRTRSASDGVVQPARPVARGLFDDIVDRRNCRIAVSLDN